MAKQAAAPVADREEMAKIARSIGLDPDQAQNIDVVAALFYAALSRSLLRAATGNGRADDKLVRDGGPIPIAAVVANVQSASVSGPIPTRDNARVAFARANETRKRCLCFCARQTYGYIEVNVGRKQALRTRDLGLKTMWS